MLVHYADVTPVEARPGITRRTLAWGEQTMLLHNTFDAGAVLPAHRHPQEQVTYVLEGELLVEMEDRTLTLHAGDSLTFPANASHGVTAATRVVALDAFSPPREDFK